MNPRGVEEGLSGWDKSELDAHPGVVTVITSFQQQLLMKLQTPKASAQVHFRFGSRGDDRETEVTMRPGHRIHKNRVAGWRPRVGDRRLEIAGWRSQVGSRKLGA
ncbi:hypothetical protein ACOMHN_028137 [Nucella lapillus]